MDQRIVKHSTSLDITCMLCECATHKRYIHACYIHQPAVADPDSGTGGVGGITPHPGDKSIIHYTMRNQVSLI